MRRLGRYITMLELLASSRFSKLGGWMMSHDGVKIALENLNDFFTTYDLYVEGHYELLERNARSGSVLWDIGANLGAVSLIFARNPKIAHVYAYEPMPQTLDYADRSFRANPQFASKITLERVGVGDRDGQLRVNYTRKAKAAIGISSIPKHVKLIGHVRDEDLESIEVRLSDAAVEFKKIRERHPDAPILLKLDAEGAEYQIIERLVQIGVLGEIEAAAIEWHDQPGAEFLTSRLHAAGFQTSTRLLLKDGSIGMIQAWRSSLPTAP